MAHIGNITIHRSEDLKAEYCTTENSTWIEFIDRNTEDEIFCMFFGIHQRDKARKICDAINDILEVEK
jgi:hypothetical protein